MLDDYDLQPAINKGKCFRATPPGGDIPREEPPSDSQWVADLYRSCCEAMGTPSKEPNPFQRHLEEKSLGAPVKEALYILFRRFSGELDEKLGPLAANEKTTLAGMLMEDIDKCTDGLLDRALRVISKITRPQNPDEYLYRVRQGLVDRALLELPQGNEIHNWNRASMIAAQEGLGVQPNNRKDPNIRSISDGTLKIALQKTFERHFTPYELPLLLRGALLNEVTELGYGGKQEGGYEVGPMERITDAVGKLLPDLGLKLHDPWSSGKIFAWHSPEEEGAEEIDKLLYASFYELKLDFILENIYQSLIKNGYLDENKLQPRHLLDFAAHWEACQQAKLRDSDLPYNALDEQTYIQKLFQEKQYGQLGKIFERYPSYWKHLLERLDLLPYTRELIQFVREALRISLEENLRETRWNTQIHGVPPVLTVLLSTANRYNEETIKELFQAFTQQPYARYYKYLALVLKYEPNLSPAILEAIDQHKQLWPRAVLQAMLFGTGSKQDQLSETDILQQAVACNKPQILRGLLQFLKRYGAADTAITEALKNLFLGARHHGLDETDIAESNHIVEYALESEHVQGGALQQVLAFITNEPTMFDDSELNKLSRFDLATLLAGPEHAPREASEEEFQAFERLKGLKRQKLKIFLDYLFLNEARLSAETISALFLNLIPTGLENVSAKQLEGQFAAQWEQFLNRGRIRGDAKCANTLSLLLSKHKLLFKHGPKLEAPGRRQPIAFILERLSLFNLSSTQQKALFEKILSNIEDTSLLLQQLLTDDTVRNQWKTKLPELLCVLLPKHLKTLQKESEILHRQSQLPHSPGRQLTRSLTDFFHSSNQSELLIQKMEFTQKWIQALTTPNSGDNNIRSALMGLKSESASARFLLKNRGWDALFELCYRQAPAAVPRPGPSAPA